MNDLASLPSLTQVIARFQIATKKSLGQHFLLDSGVTDYIVRFAGPLAGVNVIEVGPGPGGLTRSLLKAGAAQVYAIEKDERCLEALQQVQSVSDGRLQIVMDDALEARILDIVPSPRKIVANLPYNVGTLMLLGWLESVHSAPESFQSMTLMFQKEVAERIIAAPGTKDFGRLSVLSQWLCECRYDMELPPEAFTPPPKVSSAVVTLIPRAKPLVDVKKETLELVVAKAFNQRRKMLRVALKGLAVAPETLLEKAGVDGTMRAEQLDVITLCNLALIYQQLTAK